MSVDTKHVVLEKMQVLHGNSCAGIEVYTIPVCQFPASEEEVYYLRGFLQSFTTHIRNKLDLSIEVFVQFTQLHLGDAAKRFAMHGREWMPQVGLGVWPDRAPPTLWTREEFQNLGPDDQLRRVMHQVFQITTGTAAKNDARNAMLGSGTIVQILTADKTGVFLAKANDLLLPHIIHPSYTCFPFYVPLLEYKTLTGATFEELHAWFCGGSVYIRESPEDLAVLIASREPLSLIFEELGGELEDGAEPIWRIPITS